MSKEATTSLDLKVRANRLTGASGGPHEWSVDVMLGGSWWSAGHVREHRSGGRSGYEAAIQFDGPDGRTSFEAAPSGRYAPDGAECERGLGFASQVDAVKAVAAGAAFHRIADWSNHQRTR